MPSATAQAAGEGFISPVAPATTGYVLGNDGERIMETAVLYIGWATVIGAILLACGWVWYYALFWLFNAIKNTAAMGQFVRMYVISAHRKRRREKQRYINNVLLSQAQKVGAGRTAPEGHNAKVSGAGTASAGLPGSAAGGNEAP